MASTLQLTVRRTASALSSTAFKSPTRQILRSKALPAVTTRGLTVCSRRSTLISQKQYQTPIRPQTQIRWSSDKPEKTVDPESLTFRQWGFEDVRQSPSNSNFKHQGP